MMRLRNIDADPMRVETWGVEGMLEALERGDLLDWRKIRATIERDPASDAADALEQALDLCQSPGPKALLGEVLKRARHPEQAVALRLRQAVRRTGLSLREFAPLVGTSHSRLTTYLGGRVQPSATMAYRIEQVAARLA
ncbi:MAG: helix-turn-helix transcriptional regulator [Promicromonosporaceae bacterium]|nr:helix-turn-helix transcriptional regulator [Promicromonosporaceae bacterium]